MRSPFCKIPAPFTIIDHESEPAEERFVTVGIEALGRVLTVVYTWRDDDIRMISARVADRQERQEYENQ
jgi:uncharacterized protein